MFIVPITRMPSLEPLEAVEKGSTPAIKESGSTFSNIFERALRETEQAEAASNKEDELLATGDIDDLHTAMIQAQQTQASVEFTTQLMSKAVGAYNQIMSMQV